MNLDRVALCAQGLFELLQKKLYVIFGGQRTHHANAEDFACERPKTAGDFNARFIQKAASHFRLVNTWWNAHRVQGRNSVPFGNVQAQAHPFYALDKGRMAAAVPLPSVFDSLLGDEQQRLA